jgi:hypothetical protein
MSLGLFNCRLIQTAGDQLFFLAGVTLDPMVKTIFTRNQRMSGGVLGVSVSVSFGGGSGRPPLAIPALESALGSHPCGALPSVQVPSV